MKSLFLRTLVLACAATAAAIACFSFARGRTSTRRAEAARVESAKLAEQRRQEIASLQRNCSRLLCEAEQRERDLASGAKEEKKPETSAPSAPRITWEEAVAEAQRRMRVAHLVHQEMYLRPKFAALGLGEAHWETYKKLSLDLLDARSRATSSELRGPELQRALAEADASFQTQVRALMGDAAYDSLEKHQSRLAQTNEPPARGVQEFGDLLRFSSTPLTASQTERLAELFHRERAAGAFAADLALSPAGQAQAEQLLSPAQVEALRRWQTSCASRKELQALLNQQASRQPPPPVS